MSVKINISRSIDDKFVEVETTSPKVPTRYFKVPQTSADEFCKEYKQFDKDQSVWSGIRIMTPTLVLCTLANHFTKSKGKAIQWASAIGAGLIGVFGATHWNTNIIINKENALLKKHSAEEFSKETKKLPFLNKAK